MLGDFLSLGHLGHELIQHFLGAPIYFFQMRVE